MVPGVCDKVRNMGYTDDNPTIGLILCAEKNEAVAKYSVLNDRKQIFASKYMLYLPTEKELALELERERRLIEAHLAEQEQLALSDRDSRAAFLEAENEA